MLLSVRDDFAVVTDLQADATRSALEGEIDQLAQRGQLYGFSEDKVKIAEGKE